VVARGLEGAAEKVQRSDTQQQQATAVHEA
jgi:hypothetical protein